MSDTAVQVAKRNAVRNGFPGIKVVHSDAYNKIEDMDFSLISVFGGVKVREYDGYYVLIAEKRGKLRKRKGI